MRRRSPTALASSLALGLLLAACSDPPAAPRTAPIEDHLGRTVVLPDTARRVLSLAPNLTEIVVAVGAEHRLAGASHADDYPPRLAGLPRFSTYPLDYERMAALRPDLVLATDQINAPAQAEPLSRLGIPTFFLRFDALADVPRAMRQAGALLGVPDSAEAAARAFEGSLDTLRERVAGLGRPLVLLLVGDDPLYAFGRDSYTQALIEAAGGRSATADFPGAAVTLQSEWVLEQQPDVIVGLFGDDYPASDLLAQHPTWRTLSAARRDRIYTLHPDYVSRPGPRLAEGAWRLARLLHPELSADSARVGA